MADPRIRLIERICRLPEVDLPQVEAFLDELDKAPRASAGATLDWPHAPLHQLGKHGTYIVTGATVDKAHFFRGDTRLNRLEADLLRLAKVHGVQLEAWSVFSNHYHFIAHTSPESPGLARFLSHLHTQTAAIVNGLDGTSGRAVWFNFWDTELTFEKSYLARLNYVHQNPVKHGLVRRAADYRWCSAAWFERTASRAQVQTIYSFKTDRDHLEDDYDPVL